MPKLTIRAIRYGKADGQNRNVEMIRFKSL